MGGAQRSDQEAELSRFRQWTNQINLLVELIMITYFLKHKSMVLLTEY